MKMPEFSDEQRQRIAEQFTEWVDELTPARWELIQIRIEREIEDWGDGDRVYEVFKRVAFKMMIAETIDDLVREGRVVVTGVDEDGNYTYEQAERYRKKSEE